LVDEEIIYHSPETVIGKISYYTGALKRSTHFKFRFVNTICRLMPEYVSGVFRGRLYRLAGFQIGYGSFIMGNLELLSGNPNFYSYLKISDNCVIGTHVTVNLDAPVTIGNNVTVGPFTKIYTGSHRIGPGSQRCLGHEVLSRPVTIEDGCWIGLGAIILPGVTIGHGCVVAAGAVVMEDMPPNHYIEGNPATAVYELPFGDE
jgi:acetyltransferase-like isoleucine patch superfamily enzyme